MRVSVLGGGPGGLYFSALWKSRHPADDVRLFEQNPADATWGFGVVFSDRALEFLREDDPETVDLIAPRMETWRDITLVHRGKPIAIDGVGFSAIGRLELLQLLQQRARAAGVTLAFGSPVGSPDDLGDCDLIVAADGVNSLLRRAIAAEFGTSSHASGRQVRLVRHDQALRHADANLRRERARHLQRPSLPLRAGHEHLHRRVRPGNLGPRRPRPRHRRREPPHLRAGVRGHAGTDTRWFPTARSGAISRGSGTTRWSVRNVVLIGDALRTAHYSIGSGTRLAIEDALALTKALEAEPGDLAAALARYEATRRPVVEKLVAASRLSAAWYERFPEHMRLAPVDLAMSYIRRSGRVDDDRLRTMAPKFMALYDAGGGTP